MDVQDGAPWRDLPECYGKWITVCRRFNRWSGNGAMERLFTALQEERIIAVEIRVPAPGLHEREGPPARGRAAQEEPHGPMGLRQGGAQGTEHGVERVFNRMKHHRKAATRYDRLDATFLANLQLILITIQLKNTSKPN